MNLHKESDQTNVKTNDLYGSFAHALLHQYFFLLALILFIVTVSTHKVSRNTGSKKPPSQDKTKYIPPGLLDIQTVHSLPILSVQYHLDDLQSAAGIIHSFALFSFMVKCEDFLFRNVTCFHYFTPPTSGLVSAFVPQLRQLLTVNNLTSEVNKERWVLLKDTLYHTKKGVKYTPIFVHACFY